MSTALRPVLLYLVCVLAITASEAPPRLPDTSDPTRGLDLAGVDLTPIYEADLSSPLRYTREAALLDRGRRVREPGPEVDWVLEGKAHARVEEGRLYLTNDGGHLVFWNTRRFPGDFLLEFGVVPHDPGRGLNIVFFAATGRNGESIFDPGQPVRDGDFRTYHSGGLNAYHASYWATSEEGAARGTAHIRKNHGFHLVANGRDFIANQGRGPHRVRVLKLGGRVEVEVNGRIAARWLDDGQALGPVLRDGFIGLRQMSRTQECAYTHFKVWAVARRGG